MPIFFASLSFHLHFDWNLSFITFAAVLTLAAIIGKVVGCGAGYVLLKGNYREALIIGFGMNGRGAVEIVVASVVLKLSTELMSTNVISEPLLTNNQFSALILMAFITTMIAPATLKWSVMRTCRSDPESSVCALWDKN